MRNERLLAIVSLVLGAFAFAVVLAYHHVVDGDLWARLAVGAHVWKTGAVMRRDMFAFTPTLPQWVDHEWGAGLVFFTLLNWFGPVSLMIFKIMTALGALVACIAASRVGRAKWSSVLVLAIPCALAVLPGYAPVVRSQVLTYLCFAVLLWWLELMQRGRRWPAFAIVALMLVWANVHGGFIVGLLAIAVYAASLRTRLLLATLLAAVGVTCIDPYGLAYWSFLVPAWLHPRADIGEWGQMPVWGFDPYVGFRLAFVVVLGVVLLGWKRRTWIGLTMLGLTAAAGWLHRRHAPFFGLAALVYVGPYLDWPRLRMEIVAATYVVITGAVVWRLAPGATLEPAVSASFYPVRAVDVLEAARAEGNLATPFRWGSYVSWRLAPRIKVSEDGRYEEVYPDETFEMNRAFFYKDGANWDELLRRYRVDFVLLDLRATRLQPDDLRARGYEEVWLGESAVLLAHQDIASSLRAAAANLPPTTREPLDPHLADRWLTATRD
ncbi:MAG TPA: hypothetical protein VMV72_06975 [Verrucomicrobiae bacterium]|nr:hypothetical protein [Verrucomicrobiae bacterium]